MRRTVKVMVMVLCSVSLLAGCEQVNVRTQPGDRVAEPRRGAIEVMVTPSGVEKLYRQGASGGVALEAPALLVDDVQIGPLSQSLPIGRLEASTHTDAATLQFDFNAPRIIIPTRSGQGIDTVICRWQVRADQGLAAGDVAIAMADGALSLEPVAQAQAQLENARVDPIGACPLEVASEQMSTSPARAQFEQALIQYAEQALADAVHNLLTRSPLEPLGLVDGTITLTHLSPFENRRGQMRITGQDSEEVGAARLTSNGLEITRDAAVRFVSAPCAPLDPFSEIEDVTIPPIDVATLTRNRADFAIAIAQPYLTRVAQAATRGGFACLGLESLGQAGQLVSTSDLFLEDISIETSLLDERSRLAISPGALPQVTTSPGESVLQVRWPELGLGIWSDVFETPTRVANLVADVTFTLRVEASRQGYARLTVETLTVENATLASEWMRAPAEQQTLDEWARRAMLVALGDAFELPLPLAPGTPATLLETQVREDDVVFLFSLEVTL
ncbi:MAG: hypothetical protein VYE40_04010 [Myxococcota bacterium]|nr:hypothetical protein [Myxococcota bacterium]